MVERKGETGPFYPRPNKNKNRAKIYREIGVLFCPRIYIHTNSAFTTKQREGQKMKEEEEEAVAEN